MVRKWEKWSFMLTLPTSQRHKWPRLKLFAWGRENIKEPAGSEGSCGKPDGRQAIVRRNRVSGIRCEINPVPRIFNMSSEEGKSSWLPKRERKVKIVCELRKELQRGWTDNEDIGPLGKLAEKGPPTHCILDWSRRNNRDSGRFEDPWAKQMHVLLPY